MTPFELAAREHANSRGAKGTRKLYLSDLDRWLTWCAKHGHDAAAPTLAAASAFKDELLETQAALTVRRTLAALAAMYAHAVSAEHPLATWNPWKRVPRPSADNYSPTEAITRADVQKIVDVAARDRTPTGVRDVAVLWILYETGLRRSSVASLRRDKVIRREDKTVVKVLVKGAKYVESSLGDESCAALEAWLAIAPESPHVFPAMRGSKALHASAINKIIYARAKAAGVKGAHPHRFRAAFATESFDAGIPLHEIQAAMHHAGPGVTGRYDRGKRGGGVVDALSEYRKRAK
jgi:site-specific recombinase XerD